MPRRARKPCGRAGCGELVEADGRYCEAHRHSGPQRAGSTARLYDYRWQQARAAYLREHPLCRECQAQGRVEPATEVDHVIPHRGDRELFWRRDNWQPLCHTCHGRKSGRERDQ